MLFETPARRGKDAAHLSEMICSWAPIAEKYRAGEISKEDYDKWRYNYPRYDQSQIWAEVPSQELSDTLVKAFRKETERLTCFTFLSSKMKRAT